MPPDEETDVADVAGMATPSWGIGATRVLK